MKSDTETSSIKTAPRLRPTRLDDYAQIQQLESAYGLLTLEPQDWRALLRDNPLRQQRGSLWPFGWVLEDSTDRVVGSVVNIPTRYQFDGQELIAATGRAWVVAPEFRAIALWLMDEYFNQENVDLFVNTTVNALAVDTFSAFGSERIPLGDWSTASYWITGYRGFVASALRIQGIPFAKPLAMLPAGVLNLKDRLGATPLCSPASSATIEEVNHFDVRFDSAWRELVTLNPDKLLGFRDRQTLEWHFAGPLRAGNIWIFIASRNGLLRAYSVFKRQDHPPSGLRRMRLVDYQNLEPETDHLLALVHAAYRRCIAENIYVLEYVGRDLPKLQPLDQVVPYRRKLPAWPFYYKAANPELDIQLRIPHVWDPSSFDGDASM